MTNSEGNSVGIAAIAISVLIVVAISMLLSSCGSTRLTHEQQMKRAEIDKEMDKLWVDYSFRYDSLLIEYENVKK